MAIKKIKISTATKFSQDQINRLTKDTAITSNGLIIGYFVPLDSIPCAPKGCVEISITELRDNNAGGTIEAHPAIALTMYRIPIIYIF